MELVWHSHSDRPHFRFAALAQLPGVVHGVFPRFGRDGVGQWTAVNYGADSRHDPESAWENRRLSGRIVGVQSVVFARQVHGVRTGVWSSDKVPADDAVQGSVFPDTDALITNVSGVGLGMLAADCQSVFLVDPVRRAIANIHSGWRGSVGNIVGHTVAALQSHYGSCPADIVAAIAPSLGPCCAQYIDWRRDFPATYRRYRGPGDRFDFWRISADQLTAAGVSATRISVSGVCTRCNPQLFYSYRGQRSQERCATLIGLQSRAAEER